jgi:hypothetical protein
VLSQVIIISLIITALHFAFMQGNFLSPVRMFMANGFDIVFGRKWSLIIQKPLWGCLPCMASVWGLIFCGFNLPLICAVCGLNVIICQSLVFCGGEDEVIQGSIQETEYHDDVPTISRHKTNSL